MLLFSQTLSWEAGKGQGAEGRVGVAREMQLAFKKILLFSVILPLASLEGQGCHVTCCQGPEMPGENVGDRGSAHSPRARWLCSPLPRLGADIWKAAAATAEQFGCSCNRGVAASYIISRHEVPGAFFFLMTNFRIPASLEFGTVHVLCTTASPQEAQSL